MSKHMLEITSDVSLSKKFPSPTDTLRGEHDLKNFDNHFPLGWPWHLANFLDVKYGTDKARKTTWIRMNMFVAMAPMYTTTAYGKFCAVMKTYSVVTSAIIAHPRIMDMIGVRSTKLVKFEKLWARRYWTAMDGRFRISLGMAIKFEQYL